MMLARHGVTVLVPVIAPYAVARQAVRDRHAAEGQAYLEVHVATPLDVCSERDVKGLYARQARGEMSGLTGVDDPYEVPLDPDLRLDTSRQSVAESAAAVLGGTGGARARVARIRPRGRAGAASGRPRVSPLTSLVSGWGGAAARPKRTRGSPRATGPRARTAHQRAE
jgi:hypothetical protein